MRHFIIIDTHVIMRSQVVLDTYLKLPEELRDGFFKALFDWLASGSYIPEVQGEIYPIFAFDWKDSNRKYWRSYAYAAWIASLEKAGTTQVKLPNGKKRKPTSYKGGRKLPSASEAKFFTHFIKVLKNRYFTLGALGFEADDIAGHLVRSLGASDIATLVTIDSDWLGLVQPGKVGFYNIIDFQPGNRYRTTLEHVQATNAASGVVLTKPSDIWVHKHEHGDKSDALLPGTPLDLISLLEPRQAPNISYEILDKPLEYDYSRNMKSQRHLNTLSFTGFR